jgi:hypothetical protein
MERDATRLRRLLLDAELTGKVVDAAWPGWWDAGKDDEPAAREALRHSLAQRLGLSSKSLMGDRVEFVWRDEARFKHLKAQGPAQLAALTSFGMAVGSYLLRAAPAMQPPWLDAAQLRTALLELDPWVGLSGLVGTAWELGIPIVHLRVFPLAAKGMQAMVVTDEGRHAILLGRDASYPAPVAFTVAHEIGHIACGHLGAASALVDFEWENDERDIQETEADRFALELLTGTAEPLIDPGAARFTGEALAKAAMSAGKLHRIEPGTLVLVLAHRYGCWPAANEALSRIYDQPRPIWAEINRVAVERLSRARLDEDAREFLWRVLGQD